MSADAGGRRANVSGSSAHAVIGSLLEMALDARRPVPRSNALCALRLQTSLPILPRTDTEAANEGCRRRGRGVEHGRDSRRIHETSRRVSIPSPRVCPEVEVVPWSYEGAGRDLTP
jgi:hypothetical protein